MNKERGRKGNCQADTLPKKLANGLPLKKKKREKKKAKLRKKHTLVTSQALGPLHRNPMYQRIP